MLIHTYEYKANLLEQRKANLINSTCHVNAVFTRKSELKSTHSFIFNYPLNFATD